MNQFLRPITSTFRRASASQVCLVPLTTSMPLTSNLHRLPKLQRHPLPTRKDKRTALLPFRGKCSRFLRSTQAALRRPSAMQVNICQSIISMALTRRVPGTGSTSLIATAVNSGANPDSGPRYPSRNIARPDYREPAAPASHAHSAKRQRQVSMILFPNLVPPAQYAVCHKGEPVDVTKTSGKNDALHVDVLMLTIRSATAS